MIFEEPTVEFVAVKAIDISTSGSAGTDSCYGPAAEANNCSDWENYKATGCGDYVIGQQDHCSHYQDESSQNDGPLAY